MNQIFKLPNVLFGLHRLMGIILIILSHSLFAKDEIIITESVMMREIENKWKIVNPESNPPERGEFIRLGFRYTTDSDIKEVKRTHSVDNRRGKEYDFEVTYKNTTVNEGEHISYATFKVPGDAPNSLEYEGSISGKKAGKEKVKFDFSVTGETKPVTPEVRRVWIAPPRGQGSVREKITRPLLPGEVVRLVAQFYTEREYHDKGDQLDVKFSMDGIEYPNPKFSRCAHQAGFHITYRTIMVPTVLIGDFSPYGQNTIDYYGTVTARSTPDLGSSRKGTFETDPGRAGDILDPIPPALYISYETPREFLDPKVKRHDKKWNLHSDKHVYAGDSFYVYIVWKVKDHKQPSDMVLRTLFEIPELEIERSWSTRWRLRVGYSYKKITIPADCKVTQATFNGALDAIGGSGEIIYGDPVEFRIKPAKK